MVKRTVTFKRISAKDFHNQFHLDSPGYYLAKDALAAGEIATPVEMVEVLCLGNQLYMSIFWERMLVELKPLGLVEEYLELSQKQSADFVVRVLGKKRSGEILREVMTEVRKQAKIGTGENEKSGA